MRKEDLLRRINKLNAADPMVRDVMKAIGTEMDLADAKTAELIGDMFFDTCTETMLKAYEKEAAITPQKGQNLEGRRAAVEAKWKSSGKADLEILRQVAASWKNGKVEVDFVDNKIQIAFTDEFGLPEDRAGLEIALDEVKPAHLPIVYFVRYLMLEDIESMTLTELETQLLKDFAFTEV